MSFVVVEIDRRGQEVVTDQEWETHDEAEEERYTLARVARLNWPDLGYHYEIREVSR